MNYLLLVTRHWGKDRGKEYVGPISTLEEAEAIAVLVRDSGTSCCVLALSVPAITVETG